LLIINFACNQGLFMQMIRAGKPLQVRLSKDLTRSIKRGHAWLYSDAIETVRSDSGVPAILSDRKGEPIAVGIYDPLHPILLRVCRTQPPLVLDDQWVIEQITRAAALRAQIFDANTTGYRLVAGEGDGLPGLIIDVYDRVAVMKLDGGGPENFYRPQAIANWLRKHLLFDCIILRSRERGRAGETLVGNLPEAPIRFLENGLQFTADVVQGQKTGFFLDQRDNRALVEAMSKGLRILNLFSFNGGFSVAAGRGGASEVTSVDIAAPAIEAVELHWELNALKQPHAGFASDCFVFLEEAIANGEQWDLVICDPPSFAPSEKARDRALTAYSRLAQLSARVTVGNGLLALASCSSHVDAAAFAKANFEGLGRSRRKATLLNERGLPVDHPTPFAMPEMRYLKFQLMRLD
jgi:23S rRNA (cytosine1962-C5)-methyltransferase